MPDRICADCGEPGAGSPYEGRWFHGHVEGCITALRTRLAEVERERNRARDERDCASRAFNDAFRVGDRMEAEIEQLTRERDEAREREAKLREAAQGGPRLQFVLMHASGCPFVTQSAECECGLDRFRRALADAVREVSR